MQRREKLETRRFGFCLRNSQSIAHVLYVHKPLEVSGFSLNVNYGFPIHRCRSTMERASCISATSKRDTECTFKVEIKTLHHTKLRSLYKSCYSACIKDNKTYSSLLFFKYQIYSNLLLKWLSGGRKLPYAKTLTRMKFASKYMGSVLQAGEMP